MLSVLVLAFALGAPTQELVLAPPPVPEVQRGREVNVDVDIDVKLQKFIKVEVERQVNIKCGKCESKPQKCCVRRKVFRHRCCR